MALEDVNRLAMRPFRLSWRQSRRTITSQRSHTAGSWDKNAKNASSVVARRAVDSLAHDVLLVGASAKRPLGDQGRP